MSALARPFQTHMAIGQRIQTIRRLLPLSSKILDPLSGAYVAQLTKHT
jgi:hypothetical protein